MENNTKGRTCSGDTALIGESRVDDQQNNFPETFDLLKVAVL